MPAATSWLRAYCLGAACFAAACASDLPGTPVPADAFYFPIGLARAKNAPADSPYVYVLSSNFDLRFNAGWLSVVDVAAMAAGAPREVAITRQLLVPSLGGEIAISDTGDQIILGHRGTGVLSLVEADSAAGVVHCGLDPGATAGLDTSERRTDCDSAHLYTLRPDGADAELDGDYFHDPYALLLFDTPEGRRLAIGYQLTPRDVAGIVTFFDVSTEPGVPQLTGQRSRLFGGLRSTTQLALQPNTTPHGAFVAAVGRRSSGDADEAVVLGMSERADETSGVSFPLGTIAGGLDGTSIAFAPDGGRAFVTVSYPVVAEGITDGLIALQSGLTSETPVAPGEPSSDARPLFGGGPTAALRGVPSSVTYVRRAPERGGDLLFVPAFQESVIYALVPGGGHLDVLVRLDLPVDGPFRSLGVDLTIDGVLRHFVLFSTFFDHGLLLLDVTEADPAAWTHVHLRDETLPRGVRTR